MDKQQFSTLCKDIFAQNPAVLQPNDQQIDLLCRLTEEMLRVNAFMNLTAITDYSDIILKHYVDSVSIASQIPEGVAVADIGCGAGFPSLPLAICRPDLQITAIDSTGKRIHYIEQTAKLLGLTNLHPITMRAEDGGKSPEYREKFHTVTARAVAALPILCELCLPYAQVGGQWIAMKASKAEEETALAKHGIEKCGGEITAVSHVSICRDGACEPRCLITVHKKLPTPKNFPRNFAHISKKPL